MVRRRVNHARAAREQNVTVFDGSCLGKLWCTRARETSADPHKTINLRQRVTLTTMHGELCEHTKGALSISQTMGPLTSEAVPIQIQALQGHQVSELRGDRT